MKKIPTLFEREYANHKVVGITDKVTEGCEAVLRGDCVPTVKVDGSCTAIIGGKFYKRFDAKKGRKAPEGAIPCCDPDPITGHWPHWVLVDENNPADKWFLEAFRNSPAFNDWTYEAVGLHFQGNPYHLDADILVPHGSTTIEMDTPITFEQIREYLRTHEIEGIVFWKDGEPLCKIKRSDFGFEWPVKNER